MGKFYGPVGYAVTEETKPGVWEEMFTEHRYYGDITKMSRRYEGSGNLNDNLTINNMISILADAFAFENFSSIRYVEWMGVKWTVTNVEVLPPRLVLTLGGVYNG